jgi:hypothetical protein
LSSVAAGSGAFRRGLFGARSKHPCKQCKRGIIGSSAAQLVIGRACAIEPPLGQLARPARLQLGKLRFGELLLGWLRILGRLSR